MEIKEKLTYLTCIVSFTLGWALVILDFFIPPIAEVSDSTLYVLGQALIYTASVLGIANYYNNQLKDFKSEVRKQISK